MTIKEIMEIKIRHILGKIYYKKEEEAEADYESVFEFQCSNFDDKGIR